MTSADPLPERVSIWFRLAVVLFGLLCLAARGANAAAGNRLSARDIVVAVPGLRVLTFVPVSPGFDYGSCTGFPRPMDLRCDLFAQGGFDAEGRQYATRATNSDVSTVLTRTEIWRTSSDGGTELVAFLEPRPNGSGGYNDGRIEKIAVDPVRGHIYVVLATRCYPLDEDACSDLAPAIEIVRIEGLRSLAEVLAGAADPPPFGSGPGEWRPRIAPHPAAADDQLAPVGGAR